ncbi:MAG TPA: c-type cytochrome domain-containing protein [Pirellulales bacterium]|nr:c-type cytochrome domain-containing protein [Pirellulales bacterium]
MPKWILYIAMLTFVAGPVLAADSQDKQADSKAPAKPAAVAKASATKAPAATTPAAKPAAAPAAVKPAAAAKPVAKPAAKPVPRGVPSVSFSKQIAPILLKNCAGCHGTTEPKGEYQLHTFALATKPGESGDSPITPGKLDASYLYKLVSSKDTDERMPKDADPLPAAQIALVKLWIEQGARFDGPDKQAPLASLVPRKIHPAPPASYRVPIAVTALCFRPDGKELAIGGYHEITIWDPASGKLLRRIKNVEQRIYGLDYKSDGSLLAAAGGTPGESGEVALYDPAKAVLVRVLATTNDVAFGVAFNPQGTKLAACAADRSIRIFDVAKGAEERLIEDHADWVMGVAWNKDGTQLASASRDKTSKVFDLKTGESLATYPGHGETVYSVQFTPDGKQVMSAGGDKKVHFWNPTDGKQAAVVTGFSGEVFRVELKGGRLFSCSSDRMAREHKAADRSQVRVFSGHKDYVYALDFNEPTSRLATGSFDGEVRIWDTASGKQLLAFQAAPGYPPPSTAQVKK